MRKTTEDTELERCEDAMALAYVRLQVAKASYRSAVGDVIFAESNRLRPAQGWWSDAGKSYGAALQAYDSLERSQIDELR